MTSADHSPAHPHGSPTHWFLGGPPFSSALFADVIRRLGHGELVELLDPERPDDGWAERAVVLAARARVAPAPVVLVAHGLAVPTALAAARLPGFAGVVVMDGPVTTLDPVTAGLARLGRRAGPVARALLQPDLWTTWLASSAGLRRMVANPYVMDRDTVVALASGLVSTQGGRRALIGYVRSLGAGLPDPAGIPVPLGIAWGSEDSLYPSFEADYLYGSNPGSQWVSVPGGRWLHPVERPWFLADSLRTLGLQAAPGGPDAT